nr:cilia- and flagella-associated protein 65-like [Ciona intestinalis]|eukprot:XP_026691738.1 cilia- and flagella-associated protein 65-like [Ciona intestinalis]
MGSTMAIMDQHPEYNSVPSEQKVPVPGQLLFLSEERISFGNVPLFSRSRHIVFLNNKSIDRHFSYSWHAASDVVNDVLRIEPVHGYLKPGQSKMTKVTFYATGQPAFYDLDLICEVVDEIKMSNFKTELQAWEAEQERQSVEFVISEEDIVDTTDTHASSVSPRRNLENILNKNNSRLRLTESQLSTAQVDYKTFQTLPPIRFEDPVKLPSNRSRLLRHKADSDEWVQPQPPQPFIFHLGVTARTHGIEEFRSNFAEQSKNHFIDRTLQISCPVAIKSPSEQYSLTICDEEEKEIITSVMSNIIRGLLDDPTFQVAAKDAGSEPIPYFPQLAQEKELEEVEKTKEEGKETPHDEVSVKTPKKLMDEILKQSEESRPMSRDSNTTTASDNKSLALSCTHKQIQEQEIKRSPMFGGILEEILSSTISNIIDEALTGDVILTARPRVVALPPSRGQSASSSSSLSHKSGSSNSRRRRQHSKSSAKRGNSAKSQ